MKLIRDDPAAFDKALARRGLDGVAAELLALDDERRTHITRLQDAQTRRNAASKLIGKAKAAKDEDTAASLMRQVSDLKDVIKDGEALERDVNTKIETAICELPNAPLDDVPAGVDENDNVEVRKVGTPMEFDFAARQHFDIGEDLGLMDFDAASKLSGSRFVVLKGALARLERALAQFMLDLHTGENGYQEIAPPFLVRDPALFGTAQLPKFSDDLFRTEDGMWLIPTAEVPLTNLVRERILEADELPIRVTAHTPCFRLEAGAAGRDTRGMIRQHQFSKVELVSIVRAEDANAEHERMTACAEDVLKRLQLPFRTMILCTGDMGFSARKTYDIEVWLPGENAYREISSCSQCGDFQARRMSARYRPTAGSKDIAFVHTLNGSALAVGRTLVAVMENYQQVDGSILIPDVLRPYMGGMTKIEKAA